MCFQTPNSVKSVINLEWKITGPCPGQWNANFYNELDGRTYNVYLREDTYWWSASLFSTKGQYTVEEFERLPYDQLTDESIPLAFYYDTDIDNGPKIVEEAILYLQHRFPYFLFDSKIRDQYDFHDFPAVLEYLDDNSRTELLEASLGLAVRAWGQVHLGNRGDTSPHQRAACLHRTKECGPRTVENAQETRRSA